MFYKICFGLGALIVIYSIATDMSNMYLIVLGVLLLVFGTAVAMRKVSESEEEDSSKTDTDAH